MKVLVQELPTEPEKKPIREPTKEPQMLCFRKQI